MAISENLIFSGPEGYGRIFSMLSGPPSEEILRLFSEIPSFDRARFEAFFFLSLTALQSKPLPPYLKAQGLAGARGYPRTPIPSIDPE